MRAKRTILHVGVLLLAILLLLPSNVLCLNKPSVIIAGAGPAGIAAATKLYQNGITNITILEAENRIGGRIYSTNFEGTTVDLGGEFCHGIKNNVVYELAKDYDVLQPVDLKYDFYYSSTDEYVEKTFLTDLYKLFNTIFEEGEEQITDNISVGEYLTNKCTSAITTKYGNDTQKLKHAKEFLDFYLNYLILLDAPFSIFDLSLPNYYERCEGNQFISWKCGGYKTILNILLKKYPNPNETIPIENNILLNKEVTKINWEKGSDDSKNILLECSDGSSYSADYLVFTPSLGVLKHSHKNLFIPALPENKIRAIDKLAIGAISKIFLHFPERWWSNSKLTNFGFVWSEEDKQLALKEFPHGPVKDGQTWLLNVVGLIGQINKESNVLAAWLGGQFIPEIERLSDDVVIDGFGYILNKFLKDKFPNVTKPDKILRNNWYSNPHFRGTYSYESVESRKEGESLQTILAEPLTSKGGQNVVLFAGEASHPKYYSTVHSAIETGFREAGRIIKIHQ